MIKTHQDQGSFRNRTNAIVILGVSGSGKTTIGILLAKSIGCEFHDADDFHAAEHKSKMRGGIPLTDDDRWPWLARLKELITVSLAEGKTIVLACSALRRDYRIHLYQEGVRFIYLKGDFELFQKRLQSRKRHFFNPELLSSQFEELEEPEIAITVNAAQAPEQIVRIIQDELGLQ